MTKGLVRAGLSLASLALGLGTILACGPAYADDEISIDHVQTEDGTVSVLLAVDGLPTGTQVDTDSVEVTLDGTAVEATAEPVKAGQIERTTILALDASNSMRGERFAAAKAAAKAYLAAAPADVEVGLVTFSGKVQDVVSPTTDHDSLADAIDAITLTTGTRIYDALGQAVNLAGDEGARSVLLLSDGKDQGGGSTINDAIKAATSQDVIVDVVALDQAPQDEALLTRISDASGGTLLEADSAALAKVFQAQASAMGRQLVVTFPQAEAAVDEGTLGLTVTANGTKYTDSAFVTLDAGADGPRIVEVAAPLLGRWAMLAGALVLGLGLAGVLAVALMGSRGPSAAQRRLSAYFGDPSQGSAGAVSMSKGGGSTDFAALKQQAMTATEKLVKGDFEDRIARRLSGSGSSWTVAEWLLLHAGIAVGSAFAGLILGGLLTMVLGLAAGVVLPWLYLVFRHKRRLSKFNAQLAETLGLMAGGLQAGLSLPQAVDSVVREGSAPMAEELKRVLIEQRLGVDIEEALDGVGERMDCPDFSWVVMAIRIQREVGGNLAEILNTVADTLREREFLRRQVKALSAEGRISAYILGGMPPAMFGYMMLTNREYARVLYTTTIGWVMLAAGCVLLTIGGFMMKKLATVEV